MAMRRLLHVVATAAVFWRTVPLTQAAPTGFVDEGVGPEVRDVTGFNFAPKPEGGSMLLIAAKGGFLHVVPNPNDSDDSEEILDISDRICNNGARGLQSVLAHPEFLTNRYIYLYYAWSKFGNCNENIKNGPVNRLARFVMKENYQIDMDSEVVMFETSSLETYLHNGGDMAFGKDGHLYITIGDAGMRKEGVAQDNTNLFGTMIRITDDGGIPEDNPFTSKNGANSARCFEEGAPPDGSPDGAVCEEIYAYGLRNAFRFAMDPNTPDGQVRALINDVGAEVWEETNELVAGGNYGYPIREGPCKFSSETKCDPVAKYIDPVYWYKHNDEGGAAVGIAIVPNGVWPDTYDNSFLFADYVFDQILHVTEDSSNYCRECTPPKPGFTSKIFHKHKRMVQVSFGPYKTSQALYYASRGGQQPYNIRRIYFAGGDNDGPEAVVSADRVSGPAGMTVQFDGSGSTDPNFDALEYIWDFGDGSEVVTGAPIVTHTYDSPGTFVASLKVRDDGGFADTTILEIIVGSQPVLTLESPARTHFAVGDVFTLVGSAVDGAGNPLPDEALTWEVRQHHASHYHPFLDPTPGNGITLLPAPSPETLIAATNSYLEIIFTATDAEGVSASMSLNLQPKTATLRFDTSPSGLNLVLDDFPITTPEDVVTWENHNLRLDAVDQGPWIWESWSDGGDQVHDIIVPSLNDIVMPNITGNFIMGVRTASPDLTSSPTVVPSSTPSMQPNSEPSLQNMDTTMLPTSSPSSSPSKGPTEVSSSSSGGSSLTSGGNSLWLLALLGVIPVAGGVLYIRRRKHDPLLVS